MPTSAAASASACGRCTAATRRSPSGPATAGAARPYSRFRMSSPNAIIAEDEAVLRDELRARLAELWPELAISAEAPDGLSAVRAFNEHSPDILFLDVQMPGMTGLEVARLASGKCHVVFVTAFDTH